MTNSEHDHYDAFGVNTKNSFNTPPRKMKYEVTIQARVVKTYTVEADNEDLAYELAHELFSVLNDDVPERYEEDTLDIREVK